MNIIKWLRLKDWIEYAKLENYSNGLDISCKQLTKFPEVLNLYLNNIKYLDCSYNNLTELSEMINLVYLDCSFNNLTELSEMPNLIILYYNSGTNIGNILISVDINNITKYDIVKRYTWCNATKINILEEINKANEILIYKNYMKNILHLLRN